MLCIVRNDFISRMAHVDTATFEWIMLNAGNAEHCLHRANLHQDSGVSLQFRRKRRAFQSS